MLFSNVNGIGLDDEQFWPLYEAANDRDAVLMIHPTYPVGVEAMREYWLMPLNGFLFDTTLAASKLVFSGVVKRYPRIRWVLGHLGGTIPYLAERLDRGWRAFKECRAHIDEPPTAYLKRHFYYDTVNFAQGPLKLAIEFAGADRILAGSDYPHMIGSIPLMLEAIRALPITEDDATASSAATRSACSSHGGDRHVEREHDRYDGTRERMRHADPIAKTAPRRRDQRQSETRSSPRAER